MNILLHKQKLTPTQIKKLEESGVVAIRTNDPKDFQFLDVRVPQIEMNDMVWACLDAVNAESYNATARARLAANLLKIANEKRAVKVEEKR